MDALTAHRQTHERTGTFSKVCKKRPRRPTNGLGKVADKGARRICVEPETEQKQTKTQTHAHNNSKMNEMSVKRTHTRARASLSSSHHFHVVISFHRLDVQLWGDLATVFVEARKQQRNTKRPALHTNTHTRAHTRGKREKGLSQQIPAAQQQNKGVGHTHTHTHTHTPHHTLTHTHTHTHTHTPHTNTLTQTHTLSTSHGRTMEPDSRSEPSPNCMARLHTACVTLSTDMASLYVNQ